MALILCLVMALSLVPAYAVESGKKDADAETAAVVTKTAAKTDSAAGDTTRKKSTVNSTKITSLKNTYLLRVGTGTNGGNGVQYIGVRYEDTNGITRTKYIYPHENDLADGYQLAEKKATKGDTRSERLKITKKITGYIPDNESNDQHTGLQAASSDDFLFQTNYEIKKVIGFDIYIAAGKNAEWSGKSIYLYQVDTIDGIDMAGYFSNNYYISFSGKVYASWVNQSGNSFTLDASLDQVFHLRDKEDGFKAYDDHPAYNSNTSEYLIKFDIADIYGGGIEALATEVEDDKRFSDVIEALTVRITYLDCYGEECVVNVPAITSMLDWAAELGMIGKKPINQLVGIAQQGESIMFPCTLPGLSDANFTIDGEKDGKGKLTSNCIKSIKFIYGTCADDMAGIHASATEKRTRREAKLKTDTLNISGIQIYGSKAVEAMRASEVTKSKTFLQFPSLEGQTPIWAYATPAGAGPLSVAPANGNVKSSNWIDLTAMLSKNAKSSSNAKGTYLAVITTDNIKKAGTTEDVSMTLSYLSTTGEEKKSEVYVLSNKAKEYYGYWPSKNEADAAYLVGMSAGQKLIIQIDIDDVNIFKSATFKMSSHATDEWQMSDLKIYRVNEIGPRTARWIDETSDPAYAEFTDRIYSRAFVPNENTLVAHYPNAKDAEGGEYSKFYLDGDGNSKTIKFGEETSGDISEGDKDINWKDMQYSMTYEQTKMDLGFAKSAITYEVDVNVAGDEQSNMDDGDCGSNNLFYFKLIFEGGASAYVLANQQLTADGFRSGRTETFYVSTNEDYGSLESISIVPLGNSDSDNQDPYDKLNISSIAVTRECGGALSKTWKIDNVGWISMDYYDSAEEQSASGRRGRSEGEIANNYVVSSQGYSVNLLFQMVTDSYTGNDQTFKGSLLAAIEYYDKSGILCKKSIDVVRAMYEYANKTPSYYTATYSNDDGEQSTCAMSNEQFMLRGDHTDRFIVSLMDVKQIKSIKLTGSSEKTTTWNLKQITVNQLESDGVVQMTENDEYKRTGKVGAEISTSTSVTGYQMSLTGPGATAGELGGQVITVVNFASNDITVNESDTEWTADVKRVPNNTNDTLNMYVYMRDPATMDPTAPGQTDMDDYRMDAAITWHSAVMGDKTYQTNLKALSADKGNRVFYARGIKTKGLDCVNEVTLRASSAELVYAYVDHVVIQHVRSGVTISSYYVDFGNVNVQNQQSARPDQSAPAVTGDRQVVKLYFAPSTIGAYINPEVNDIVVSIRYKTSNDTGLSNSHYDSYNAFLGDILNKEDGSQKYSCIRPGMTAELEFNEQYVSEIIGITVSTVGNLNATLSGACAGIYTAGNENPTWCGFTGHALSVVPYTMTVSKSNVVPVKMVITSRTAAQDASTGADVPVRMMMDYITATSNTEKTYVIDNIRDYCSSGDFRYSEENHSATVEFCMFDVGSIRSITLTPYTNNGNDAIWSVQTAYFEAAIGNQSVTCNYENPDDGTTVTNSSPFVMNVMGAVTVSLKATTNNAGGTTTMRQTGANGTANIATVCNNPVTIAATVQNSLQGVNSYSVSVKENKDGVLWDAGNLITYDTDDEGNAVMVFNATKAGNYVVTVTSQEMMSSSASLNIAVGASANTMPENNGEAGQTE
ncbi:MAG: hypothetical protein KBS74_01795 [Clostridiales bacterium]|nr:hypothetical protein [Candidatus Cacconaster stercorequi]